MAIKQVALSDLTGSELTDDTHARAVVRHPDYTGALEIDLSVDESSKLVNTTLRLVEFTVYEPNKPPRTVHVETKTLDSLFKNVDFDAVLQGARKADDAPQPRRGRGRPAKAAAPKAETVRIDYTAPENFGLIHRGKVTEEEAALVRNNLEQANKNRAREGQPLIDPADGKEKKRYSF